jgi:biotin carboxyl carrier protein
MEFEYLVDGAAGARKISIERKGGTLSVRDGVASFEAEVMPVSGNELFLLSGGRCHRVFLVRDGDRILVRVGGRTFELRDPHREGGSAFQGADNSLDGGRIIVAPMPGKVIKVLVAEGEAIRKNQTLIIVEAMKMENEIKAGRDGTVAKVHVAAGALVDAARPLIEIQ